jgi:hypothetical protein
VPPTVCRTGRSERAGLFVGGLMVSAFDRRACYTIGRQARRLPRTQNTVSRILMGLREAVFCRVGVVVAESIIKC